jgi:hypothetical protein
MTHSLDLTFHEPSRGKPGARIAQIYVKAHSEDENGNILITPQCVSWREFEEQIDRLKEELDMIARKAKQKFANKERQP